MAGRPQTNSPSITSWILFLDVIIDNSAMQLWASSSERKEDGWENLGSSCLRTGAMLGGIGTIMVEIVLYMTLEVNPAAGVDTRPTRLYA